MLCQRERSPLRSRPRKCAISCSRDILLEGRPLRCFLCIASGRLFSLVQGGGRSFAVLDAIYSPLVCLVFGRVGDLDAASTDCSRDLGLLAFRAGKRAAAFGLDLGLVMGSSEVHAAPSAAPPQPRLGKTPGRARSRGEPQSPQVTTATLRSDKKASQF